MVIPFLVATIIINCLLISIYIDKIVKTKDILLFASIVTRMYLTYISWGIIIDRFGNPLNEIIIAMFMALSVDLLINFIQIKLRGQVLAIESSSLLIKLKNLEDKYRVIVENSLSGFYVIDSERKFELVNKELANMFGYDIIELLERTVYDITSEEFHSIVRENIAKRMNGKSKTICYELVGIRKSGEKIKVKVVGSRTTNGHPTITGSIILLDTDERGSSWNNTSPKSS